MKQNEYDQWNDSQEFYSEESFLPQKGVATPHEYLVECYHEWFTDFQETLLRS